MLQPREEISAFLVIEISARGRNVRKNNESYFHSKIGIPCIIFTGIIKPNLKVQSNMANIPTAQDNVASFLNSFQLYRRMVENGDVIHVVRNDNSA